MEREERWAAKERRQGVRRAPGREPHGWDDVAVGAVAGEAPVERHTWHKREAEADHIMKAGQVGYSPPFPVNPDLNGGPCP